jgi:hypothetical protein
LRETRLIGRAGCRFVIVIQRGLPDYVIRPDEYRQKDSIGLVVGQVQVGLTSQIVSHKLQASEIYGGFQIFI